MLKKDEFIVVSDEEAGAVWMPECGGLKATTSEHAKKLEECMQKYFQHELSPKEEAALEEYLKKSFENIPKLHVEKYPNLPERKSLRRLEIMVANDCNLACKYCYANAGTYGKKSQRMSPETAVGYLHSLLDDRYEQVEKVSFFGGEATLCPHTIEAVCEYFKQAAAAGQMKNIPVYAMVTNGTLIDHRMAEIIHKYDIMVTVSVDGPQEINDLLRVDKSGKGTFEKLEEGIRQVKAAGSGISLIEATYTAKHQELGYSRAAVKEFLQQHFEVKDIVLADCQESAGNHELICTDTGGKLYDNSSDKRIILHRLRDKRFLDITCDSGFAAMALMPDGEIYPCHFFVEHPEYRIAIYQDGAFDFSEYTEVLRRLQDAYHTKNENCRECASRFTCTMCAANMLLHKPHACEIIRAQQKKAVLECAKAHFK